MNNHQRKCRKCLNKVAKQEAIKTSDGYYCETCHKASERTGMLIGGIFVILLLILVAFMVLEIRKKPTK